MKKPNIQIDDLVREMTDEEYAQHLEDKANASTLFTDDNPDA
jgi:hypothetical protein